eukprot:4291938-Pleurochrysis_carterae.AAC.1
MVKVFAERSTGSAILSGLFGCKDHVHAPARAEVTMLRMRTCDSSRQNLGENLENNITCHGIAVIGVLLCARHAQIHSEWSLRSMTLST